MSRYTDVDPCDQFELPTQSTTEQDARNHTAATIRGLRRQQACAVTSALILEWQRKAELLQCFRHVNAKVSR